MLIFIGIVLNNWPDFPVVIGDGEAHRFGVTKTLILALSTPV